MNSSVKPRWLTKGISTPKPLFSAMPSAPGDRAHAAVHGHVLAGDVLARVGSQQRAQALEVLVVAQAAQRRVANQVLFAQRLERAHGHLAREKARADGVDPDAVFAPFGRQRTREVDDP